MSRGHSNPRRKGTGKKKNQAQGLPKTTLAIAVTLVVTFIGGLYFIVHTKNESVQNTPPITHQLKGHGLPPIPEERWSYIKELENRPVGLPSMQEPSSTPNQQNNRPTELTPEQRQLLEQMQADMRQPPTQLAEVPYNSEPVPRSHVLVNPPVQKPSPEYTPQQNPVLQQENKPSVQFQSPQAQIPRSQTSNETSKPKTALNESRLMLQCGSFRTIEQAESVRASLALVGIESKITTKDSWNRVVVGPYKSKDGAEKMRNRIANTGISNCILRPAGG
ncbi:Cell division protein ftsN [Xenorhabdus cabanillasii JM26]|uniref:Cell division protein FtsN n=1 Tax=Xenorhabdus cabanillasii JM26 TaxID=1427517 RepID=W1IN73_9GAMM|nr:cell division protein FtsN [Xenorhabdus cabanillasii JM26]CDL79288.1 Cell division protein ftsN [Xenorhabdus cabanillasii JM26]